jgi:hypothetical protein
MDITYRMNEILDSCGSQYDEYPDNNLEEKQDDILTTKTMHGRDDFYSIT